MSELGSFVLGQNRLGVVFKQIRRWQDIQIDDTAIWSNLKTLWGNGKYSQALELLQNSQIVNKWNDANKINDLTSNIMQIGNMIDATDFKIDAPITSKNVPSSPRPNQIWFEVK